MACCALMHSVTYISFSQSGSHIIITEIHLLTLRTMPNTDTKTETIICGLILPGGGGAEGEGPIIASEYGGGGSEGAAEKEQEEPTFIYLYPGLVFQRGKGGHCLPLPWSWHRCLFKNVPITILMFKLKCTLLRKSSLAPTRM